MDHFFASPERRGRSSCRVVPISLACGIGLLCVLLYRNTSACLYGPQNLARKAQSQAAAAPVVEPVLAAAAQQWLDQAELIAQPLLSGRDARNGIVYAGNRERLRKALTKYLLGDDFTLAVVGGSITAGAGGHLGGHPWPTWLFDWMQAGRRSHRARYINGAVPGTLSAYMAMCSNVHIPDNADIVILEYALNDPILPQPFFNNPHRRGMELLIRKLLQLPQRPAVLLLNAYSWFNEDLWPHSYLSNAEHDFLQLATYYGLSVLSVKAAAYRSMLQGKHGFKVDKWREKNEASVGRDSVFYFDHIHPDGRTGHRVMAELVHALFVDTVRSLVGEAYTEAEEAVRQEPLLPPLIPNNWESTTQTCLVGTHFKEQAVTQQQGFKWVNKAPNKPRPKWGYIATTPGSFLLITVSTLQTRTSNPPPSTPTSTPNPTDATSSIKGTNNPGGDRPHAQDSGTATAATTTTTTTTTTATTTAATEALSSISIAYLRSYRHMGRARVTCVEGCRCNGTLLEGHTSERNSQTHMLEFAVTQAARCTLQVVVLRESSSGEHKVKLMGVVVTDGLQLPPSMYGALDYVHDMVSKDNGTYDVRNHV